MSVTEQHKKMIKLVDSKTIIPGILKEENGVKVYTTISLEKYSRMLDNGDIAKLAYNTLSMGRGVFTLGENGEIINFKGVDSRLEDKDNIAVGKVNATVYDISRILGYGETPYGITVVHFPNQSSEIRVRGASQLQNLINEKQKLDETKTKDKKGLIKFPNITEIIPFSADFCRSIGLPKVEQITEEFMQELMNKDKTTRERTGGVFGDYAYVCLQYMQDIGMPINTKNQNWKEYFSNLSKEDYNKIKDIPDLQKAINKQDDEYELGASFGQTTRILENPFRIMDLAHFIDTQNLDGVKAIFEYTSDKYEGDYISYYAETMGRNLAGFMNAGLAYNNWSHRQDFALSAEMCDDAYDDVSKNIQYAKEIDEKDTHYKNIIKSVSVYYNQIYLFASNMKVIEDAYRVAGKEVPEGYKELFIETFMENLENRDGVLKNILLESSKDFEEILRIAVRKDAIRNFEGYEEYISQFRNVLREKVKENISEIQTTDKNNKTISMQSVVSNAITQGIATEDIEKVDNAKHRKKLENQVEGVTKDD